jgi:hypothetical protein
MKKIGILFGQENSFPPCFLCAGESENRRARHHGRTGADRQSDPGRTDGYDVVIDRISQDVPFYRAWLKNEALTGCAVVNNPFWWSADEKVFQQRARHQDWGGGAKNRSPALPRDSA